MKDSQAILKGLLKMKQDALAGKILFPNCGICANLCEYANADSTEWVFTKHWLEQHFQTWPKFSGDTKVPVDGGYTAYEDAKYSKNMFSRTTRYGRLRWNLLNHLIRQAKKENV